jgi:Family of unknown function (DUF6364)
VPKNLTLTIDEDLLKSARKVALDFDTSVNQIVRDFLALLVENREPKQAMAAALKEFFANNSLTLGKNKWGRDELHERG